METVRLREDYIAFRKPDEVLQAPIPSRFNIREKTHPFVKKINLSELYCANRLNLDHAYNCLSTLGAGNHFIEANRDDSGNAYIVIHSGSRHLGKKVAMYYQKAGYKALTAYSQEEIQAVVDAPEKPRISRSGFRRWVSNPAPFRRIMPI